jgi:hypothetical protein
VAGSRLVQFLVLGGLLFVLTGSPRTDRTAHVSATRVGAMRDSRVNQTGAPLTADQQQWIEARAVEDEVLYREARRLGLDADDEIVRQRLIQKLLFLAEDLGGASQVPSEAELRAFHAGHPDRWSRPAVTRFIHIFASTREAADRFRATAVSWSEDPARRDEPPDLGESFPLSRIVEMDSDELAQTYGETFARGIDDIAVGSLGGPIASKWGWHLVRVVSRLPAHTATFEEAQEDVKVDYLLARREAAVHKYLVQLVTQYRIDVDGRVVTTLPDTHRTASRTAASGED